MPIIKFGKKEGKILEVVSEKDAEVQKRIASLKKEDKETKKGRIKKNLKHEGKEEEPEEKKEQI